MALSAAQIQALRTDIAANTNQINGVAIKDMPVNDDTAFAIAAWYNQNVSPSYTVWNNSVPIKTIRSAVNIANYTPTDAVPASGSTVQITNDQMVYQNRALACQLKQANAIFLIQGEGNADYSPTQLRQSFNDCMTTIPSGASGANQNAGWGTSAAPGPVRLAMQRLATNIEKLFAVASTAAPNAGNVGADARGSTTNPDTLVFSGAINGATVSQARSS
jgi:hypothetical protein